MSLSKQQRFIAFILVALTIFLTAAYFLTKPFRDLRDQQQVHAPVSDSLEVLSTVPDFKLVDQNDKPITLSDLRGHIWLADVIFTRCEGICPMMSSNFEKLQTKVGPDVKMVSFSVDPEYDSTAVLRDYAARYSADQTKWKFVTGHRPTIFSLVKTGFLLGVDSTGLSPNELVTHSEKFVLIDKKGQMRAYYDGTDSTVHAQILKDIETLRNER